MPSSTKIENIDLLIIGAGPAGLAAAVEAQRGGISNLLVVEKGPSHSQMIRTYYKEGKRVDAQYAGVEAASFSTSTHAHWMAPTSLWLAVATARRNMPKC